MKQKTANSNGILQHLPDTSGKSGYKGLWSGYTVIIPFDNEDYVFDVDREMIGSEKTCEIFVVGQTASIITTMDQKYSGHYIDGSLVWEGNV